MKKYLLITTLCLCVNLSYGQIIKLSTNGHTLSFKKIDTLFFEEYDYKYESLIKSFSPNDPAVLKLPYTVGFIKKNKNIRPIKYDNFLNTDKPIFTSNFYVFEDGTLEAPTSSLFFKPLNEEAIVKIERRYGVVEKHRLFAGFYFLYLRKDLLQMEIGFSKYVLN